MAQVRAYRMHKQCAGIKSSQLGGRRKQGRRCQLNVAGFEIIWKSFVGKLLKSVDNLFNALVRRYLGLFRSIAKVEESVRKTVEYFE